MSVVYSGGVNFHHQKGNFPLLAPCFRAFEDKEARYDVKMERFTKDLTRFLREIPSTEISAIADEPNFQEKCKDLAFLKGIESQLGKKPLRSAWGRAMISLQYSDIMNLRELSSEFPSLTPCFQAFEDKKAPMEVFTTNLIQFLQTNLVEGLADFAEEPNFREKCKDLAFLKDIERHLCEKPCLFPWKRNIMPLQYSDIMNLWELSSEFPSLTPCFRDFEDKEAGPDVKMERFTNNLARFLQTIPVEEIATIADEPNFREKCKDLAFLKDIERRIERTAAPGFQAFEDKKAGPDVKMERFTNNLARFLQTIPVEEIAAIADELGFRRKCKDLAFLKDIEHRIEQTAACSLWKGVLSHKFFHRIREETPKSSFSVPVMVPEESVKIGSRISKEPKKEKPTYDTTSLAYRSFSSKSFVSPTVDLPSAKKKLPADNFKTPLTAPEKSEETRPDLRYWKYEWIEDFLDEIESRGDSSPYNFKVITGSGVHPNDNPHFLDLHYHPSDSPLPSPLYCIPRIFTRILKSSLLTNIDFSGNQISYLGPETFTNAPLVNLRILNLSKNKIKIMDPKTFENLPHLRELNLSSNNIQMLSQDVFSNSPELHTLNLSSNTVRELPEGIFSKLPKLSKLNLSSNNIQMLSQDVFSNSPELHELNLSFNNILMLPQDVFSKSTKLSKLDLSKLYKPDLSSLDKLGLSFDYTLLLPEGIFSNSPELCELNLSNNRISQIAPKTFNNSRKLRILDLSKNKIGRLNEETFSNLSTLQVLNLSNNRISQIVPNTFKNLSNLRELDLRGNLTPTKEFPKDLFPENTRMAHDI